MYIKREPVSLSPAFEKPFTHNFFFIIPDDELKQAVILYFDTRMNFIQVMLFSNVKNYMIYLSIREISSELLA